MKKNIPANKKNSPLHIRLMQWIGYGLVTIALLLVLLPYIAGFSLVYSLEHLTGGDATVGRVELNPFTTHLVINNLQVDVAGARLLDIEELEVKLAGWPIRKKHIGVELLRIESPSITTEHLPEGRLLHIAGLALLAGEKREKAPIEGRVETPWSFSLDQLVLNKGYFIYLGPGVTSNLLIDTLQAGPIDTRKPNEGTHIALHSTLDGAPLTLDAITRPLAQEPDVSADIELSHLAMGRYAPFAKPLLSALAGDIAINSHIDAKLHENSEINIEQKGGINLRKFYLSHTAAQVRNEEFNWQGNSHVVIPLSSDLKFKVDGKLNNRELDIALIRQALRIQQQAIALNTRVEGRLKESGALDLTQQGTIKLEKMQLIQESTKVRNEFLTWTGKTKLVMPASSIIDLAMDGTLKLENLALDHEAAKVNNESLGWEGATKLAMAANAGIKFELDGKLNGNNLDLALTEQPLHLLQQQMDIAAQVQGEFGEDGSLSVTQQGDVQLGKLALEHEAADIQSGQLTWQGRTHVVVPADEGATVQLDSEGMLVNKELDLRLKEMPLHITHQQLQWQGTLQQPQDNQTIIDGDIVLAGLSTRNSDDSFEILTIKELDAKQLHLAPASELAVNNITVDTLVAHLQRTKEGRWRLPEDLIQTTDTRPPPEQAANKPETEQGEEHPMAIRIGQTSFSGKSRIEFSDEAVSPPFKEVAHIDLLDIGTMDSSRPEQPSHLKFESRIGKYSTFKLEGDVYPFAKRPTLQVKGNLKSFSLPPISPYAVDTIGYYVKHGQLNTELDLKIDQGIMDGTSKWTIHNLDIEGAKTEKQGEMDNNLKMPLETALTLISDKQNNIKLTVPIKGDINDPQFDVTHAINTALGKGVRFAALNYLKYTLQPYGAVLIAAEMAAGALQGNIRLDPISFQPGQHQLSSKHDVYLESIAKMFAERPGIRIKVCGMATEADRQQLAAEAAKKAKNSGKQGGKKPAQPEIANETLLQLATERSHAVKDHLIKRHDVEAARLFTCHPEIDEKPDAQPRVELLI